jgi:hypothetical protein
MCAVHGGRAEEGGAMKLHLHLKAKYFDEITAGTKTEEYRIMKPYWRKRLDIDSFDYDGIILYRGFPRADESHKIIELPYRGMAMHG